MIMTASKERKEEFQMLNPGISWQHHRKAHEMETTSEWFSQSELWRSNISRLRQSRYWSGNPQLRGGCYGFPLVANTTANHGSPSWNNGSMTSRRICCGTRCYPSNYRRWFRNHMQRTLKPEPISSSPRTSDQGCTITSYCFHRYQFLPCVSSGEHGST